MRQLSYFNVVTRCNYVQFTNDIFIKYKPGEFFKVNSLLIQDYKFKEKVCPLGKVKKFRKDYKSYIGNCLINLGNRVKFGRKAKREVVYKNNYQWWLKDK